MAETALILAFVAGFAFREFWPRVVAWSRGEKHLRELVKMDGSKESVRIAAEELLQPYPSRVSAAESKASPSIDKRRRGVAELRFRAEQESMVPLEHQAKVTANNIKAMES